MDEYKGNERLFYFILQYKNIWSKTDLLAILLDYMMKELEISTDHYAIISGYGLRDYKEVSDLDVILSEEAYNILQKVHYISKSTTGISKTEKLYIKFPSIDETAEIEFFQREHTGFPSDKFSLRNLQKNKYLQKDFLGNPYLNKYAVADIYSDVKIIDKDIILGDGYKISKERLEKNISHLQLLFDKTNDKYVKEKLEKIKKISKLV